MSEQIPKLEQLSVRQLEELIELRLDSLLVEGEIINQIKKHLWVNFILDYNFNLTLTTYEHDDFCDNQGIEKSHCLIPDGVFRVNPDDQKLRVLYHVRATPPQNLHEREAAENKIKGFLRSNGINFK